MADRQGRCTNFGNCTKADKKESISVPIGADFLCPECGNPLMMPPKPGGLNKWRIPLIAGVLVLAIASVALFFFGGTSSTDGASAERKFLAQVKTVLEECERTITGISPEKIKELKAMAESLKLADRTDELIETAKRNYLFDRIKTFGADASPQKLQPLCELAKKLGMPALVQGCSLPSEDIAILLAQGEYMKAREGCKSAGADPQTKRLCTEIDMPLNVEASMQYQKDGKSVSAKHLVDSQDLRGLILTHRDNYRLFVSVSQDNTFLYVFQKDHYGVINRLFPDPVWSQGVDNPLQKGNEYRIPTGEKEWLYLDELPASQTQPIVETIYFVASPWKANDIEELYGKIHGATTPEVRKDLTAKFLKQLQQRNDAALKCAFYKELSFEHGK